MMGDEMKARAILDLYRQKKQGDKEASQNFNEVVEYLVPAAMDAIAEGDGYMAVEYLRPFRDVMPKLTVFLQYLDAWAKYVSADWQGTCGSFVEYLEQKPDDEIAWFLLGNAWHQQGDIAAAMVCYQKANELHGRFAEVLQNAEAGRVLCTHPFATMWPDMDGFNVPIFINSYNRLECLKKLVNWLIVHGYRRIYILDNQSTYPKLLTYYEELGGENRVRVIRLEKNYGYKALWESRILSRLDIRTPYVYTDSDVLPTDSCTGNIVNVLLSFARRHPMLKKIGLGLVTEDITVRFRDRIQQIQAKFCQTHWEQGFDYAAVDTTFALYANCRHYSLRLSARTNGQMRAWHLPWYYDYDNLPEDEQYYLEHANVHSTMSNWAKEES